jgi:uncharacterized protein YjdB
MRLLLIPALALVLAACGDDEPAAPEPLTVSILPANPRVTVGQELRLSATISRNLTPLFEWASADPGIATVSLTGVVTGLSEGTTTITAYWSADSTVFGTTRLSVTGGVEDRRPAADSGR